MVYIQNAGDPWRGSERSLYLSPREKATLDGGQVTVIGTMTQMATLGHLVEMDGLVVYYQGSSPDDMEYYQGELEYLDTVADRIDLAFLPIPDLEGEVEESGFKAFLDRFQPNAVAFLDPGGREDLYPRVAELIRGWGYGSEVFAAERPGDVFAFRRR